MINANIPFAENVFSTTEINSGGKQSLYSTSLVESLITERFKIYKDLKETYISFGSCNDHPQRLKELALKSGTHKSILIAKANITKGDGFLFFGDKEDEVNEWFENELDHLREELSWDAVTYGGLAIQLSYEPNKGIDSTRDLVHAHKHDFDEFRLGTPHETEIGIFKPRNGYLYTNWSKGTRRGVRGMKILPLWAKHDDKHFPDFQLKEGNCIYFDRVYTPFLKYYPLPDYQSESTLNAIVLDSELVLFDVNELKNGLTSGYIVTFYRKNYANEDPEKESKLRAAEEGLVRNDMKGAKNNKRIVIMRATPPKSGEDPKKAFDVTPIPNNNTKDRHEIIEKRKTSTIMMGHGIPDPRIVGGYSQDAGGFSAEGDKMKVGFDLLLYTRISSFRTLLKKFFMNMAIERFGKDAVTGCEFVDNIPFREKIEKDMYKWAFTKDEYRKEKGRPAMTDEQKEEIDLNCEMENTRTFNNNQNSEEDARRELS